MPAKSKKLPDDPVESEDQEKLSILITGATSPLSLGLANKLVSEGHEVRMLLVSSPTLSGEWSLLPPGVIPFVGNFIINNNRDKEMLIDACRDVDVLFHIGSANYNYQYNYQKLLETNVIGTENVLTSYLEANNSKKNLHFIFTSTISVYGYKRPGEVLTEQSEVNPVHGYPESKLMAEKVIQAYGAANSRLNYTIFRLSKLYGLGYEGPFFKVFKLLLEGKALYIDGGNNHISLLHKEDAINALNLALNNNLSYNKIYNVSDGVNYTLKYLMDKAAELLGVESPKKSIHPLIARMISSRLHDIKYDEFEFLTSDRIVSIEKIKDELGFRPKVKIDDAGRELINAFNKEYKKVGMYEKR
ncbi:MAG: NAD-dependent epimerase/dehydratase family protein [Candidatus Micrarchaeia archaeon]